MATSGNDDSQPRCWNCVALEAEVTWLTEQVRRYKDVLGKHEDALKEVYRQKHQALEAARDFQEGMRDMEVALDAALRQIRMS